MTTGPRLLALLGLVVVAALIATAPAASAHARFVGSSPEAGTTLGALPPKVTVRFSENVRAPAFVTVTGPDGVQVASGEAEVLGAEVTRTLQGSGPAGRYELAYRVTSADGHPITGTVPFEVTGSGGTADGGAADGGTTDAAASGDSATDTGTGTGLGGGALALLLAVLVAGLVGLAAGARQMIKRVSLPTDELASGAPSRR